MDINDEEAKAWEGYGTALKPSHEPIVLARKPIEKGLSIAQNCLKWGVGAINVDGCRVEHNEKSKTVTRTAKDNFWEGKKPITKPELNKGRFPANFIHDGSDEVVGLFPYTQGSQGVKTKGTKKSIFGMKGEETSHFSDTGSAARFFYTPKAKKKERLTFNNHPTVKPISLMQYLVRLITPESGVCLDPFAGSGTTGLACMKEGRSHILIDSDSGSIDIARRRLLSEIISQEYRRAARRFRRYAAG
jgi:site-specific DNA-methyltransferase (adenine-specific)